MFKLSQETIAILTIGLTILGTVLYTTGRIEDRIDRIQSEARADRIAWQKESQILRDEARADRAAWQAENQILRDEARADRTAWKEDIQILRDESRADRETFERHITRLTQEQSQLTGIVDQMRTASR